MADEFYHEDVNAVPAGYHVRTLTTPTGHEVRIAFPPGRRKRGSGRLISILHPHKENTCEAMKASALRNPWELVKDSAGKSWYTGIVHSGSDYMAEAYPVTGRKIKRAGAPVTARGASESEAYDALLRKIEPNPRKKKSGAMSRKLEVKTLTANPGKKKNFDELEAAQQLYEEFIGREADKVTDLQEPNAVRDDFAQLGWLIEIVAQPAGEPPPYPKRVSDMWEKASNADKDSGDVWNTIAAKLKVNLIVLGFRGDKTRLCSNADGSQLYNLGGSQDLSGVLKLFKTDTSKDFIQVGTAVAVTYLAAKEFDDFKAIEYVHTLGEAGGEAPTLMYDKLKSRIFYVGGTYTVKPEGITN